MSAGNEDDQIALARGSRGSSLVKADSYLKVVSKSSRSIEIAELKLRYEEQLEEKNQRISKLEAKNYHYL